MRGSSRRSSSGILTVALIPTAASASTMASTWSLLTLCQVQEKKLAPGLLGLSTFWPASVMKTVWPSDNALVTNILPDGTPLQKLNKVDTLCLAIIQIFCRLGNMSTLELSEELDSLQGCAILTKKRYLDIFGNR